MAQRFVVLQGREESNIFWSIMRPEDTEESVRYLNDGTLAYNVLLITEDEAKIKEMFYGNF